MTPVLINRIFMGSLAAMVIVAGVGFYFASKFLSEKTIETSHKKTDVVILHENITKLKRLETEMKDKSEIVNRASQIVSDSKEYQYQDQIVRDITAYAAIAGVSISGFSFAESAATTGPTAAAKLSGVKTLDATVTLKTPIKYDNFLLFLKAIEQNLTKMQVTGVNMTPDGTDINSINNPSIGLQIYVKG